MATIKSFTSLEQSKKLAEILPLESADMHYCLEQRDIASGYEIGITPYTKANRFTGKCNIIDVQPSWSLASLLEVLPYGYSSILTKSFNGKDYYCKIDGKPFESIADNPVDACYELIIKLKELNLL